MATDHYNKYGKRWYENNQQLTSDRAMGSKHRTIDSYGEYMSDKVCAECGVGYSCKGSLHHHHTNPKTKRACVADLLHSHGLKAALEEANRDDVIILCPACHSKLHYGGK